MGGRTTGAASDAEVRSATVKRSPTRKRRPSATRAVTRAKASSIFWRERSAPAASIFWRERSAPAASILSGRVRTRVASGRVGGEGDGLPSAGRRGGGTRGGRDGAGCGSRRRAAVASDRRPRASLARGAAHVDVISGRRSRPTAVALATELVPAQQAEWN